jgi:hypothetical protein
MLKAGCTVMLPITTNGRMLQLCVIFKRKAMPKTKLLNGVHVPVKGKGCMDAAVVCDWVCKAQGQ